MTKTAKSLAQITFQQIREYFVAKFSTQREAKVSMLFDTGAVVQRYSAKNVFLEVSQNSQGNICARVSFLIKLQAQA